MPNTPTSGPDGRADVLLMRNSFSKILLKTTKDLAMDQIGDEKKEAKKSPIDQVFTEDVMTSLHRQAERRANEI